MSLIACGSIHEGPGWFSDDSRGRREMFVFGCSIMWAILPIHEWRCQDIDWVLLDEIIFLSVFSSIEGLAKITSIQSKLPTAACWSQEKREETVKPTSFMSSPVEALNLIVESKSQPVE